MIIRTREVPRWNGVMLVGISRGVVGIGHSQRNRSVVFFKKNFSEDDFVFRNGFVLGSEKKGSTGEVDVCCSPQPPEALEDPDV